MDGPFEKIIPSAKSSWLFALCLILIFSIYYYAVPGGLYQSINDHYEEQFSKTDVDDLAFSMISVTYYSPRYFDEAIPTWIYMKLTNTSADDTVANLAIWVCPPEDEVPFGLLLPRQFDQDQYAMKTEIPVLHPMSTIGIRLPVAINSSTYDAKTGFPLCIGRTTGENEFEMARLESSNPASAPKDSPWPALKVGLIELLLLPPWANLFIPVVLIASVALAERDERKECTSSSEDFFHPAFWRGFFGVFLRWLPFGLGFYVIIWLALENWLMLLLPPAASILMSLLMCILQILVALVLLVWRARRL